MANLVFNPETSNKTKEIEKMVNILINAEAILCAEKFEPVYYHNTALYEVPVGHIISVNYDKLATALYNYGYRLVKEGEDDG